MRIIRARVGGRAIRDWLFDGAVYTELRQGRAGLSSPSLARPIVTEDMVALANRPSENDHVARNQDQRLGP